MEQQERENRHTFKILVQVVGPVVSICPTEAIKGEEGSRHEVNPVKCVGCEACIDSCPVSAIMMRDNK